MKTLVSAVLTVLSLNTFNFINLKAQGKIWSVDDCIQYALEKNIQIQKAQVSNNISEINLNYSKSAWYPSLSGSVRENLSWSNPLNTTPGSTVFKGSNGTNISASSGMTVFNGYRLRNSVRKARTDYEADKYNTEIIKENCAR